MAGHIGASLHCPNVWSPVCCNLFHDKVLKPSSHVFPLETGFRQGVSLGADCDFRHVTVPQDNIPLTEHVLHNVGHESVAMLPHKAAQEIRALRISTVGGSISCYSLPPRPNILSTPSAFERCAAAMYLVSPQEMQERYDVSIRPFKDESKGVRFLTV